MIRWPLAPSRRRNAYQLHRPHGTHGARRVFGRFRFMIQPANHFKQFLDFREY